MKSYKWYTLIFLVVLIILQPFLIDWLGVSGISINFVLYFAMLFAFTKKPGQSLIIAIVLGLSYDMMYSSWLGKTMILLLMGTGLVRVLEKRVYRENVPALILFFFTAFFLLENINSLMDVGFSDYFGNFAFIQGRLLRTALYAAALSMATGLIYLLASLRGDRRISMKGI